MATVSIVDSVVKMRDVKYLADANGNIVFSQYAIIPLECFDENGVPNDDVADLILSKKAMNKMNVGTHPMTILITAKDVGRVAVDRDGDEWDIIAFTSDPEYPVIGTLGALTERFKTNGSSLTSSNLIRFADEPEQQPPEWYEVKFDDKGDPQIASCSEFRYRPDLAGQTFTYEISK